MVVGRRSHHASLSDTKRVLTRENIRSQYDAWKGYLKKGIREIAKASMGNSSRGFYSILHESPAARGQRADAH